MSVLAALLFSLSGPAVAAEPVALVELFTSQGCSSCPPADALAQELAAEARRGEQPLVVLSFHVDYWNRLGWPDPYSDAEFTARQRAYSASLGEGGRIYTPQVVVNGADHAVGSNRGLVKGLIAGALSKPATATVSGEASFAKDTVSVSVKTGDAPKNATVFVALVEPEKTNVVPRGENSGKTLSHANVVRALVEVSMQDGDGQATLSIPDDVEREDARIVAWVQDALTNHVLGAGALPRSES